MTDRTAAYRKALAMFREREPNLVARHLAEHATPGIARCMMCESSVLEETELKKLFEDYAQERGFAFGAELGWHWVAEDEEQLRDWQMQHLERVGDCMQDREGYLRSKGISRDRLGYSFRLRI